MNKETLKNQVRMALENYFKQDTSLEECPKIGENFLEKLVTRYFDNKKDLINLLSRHKFWNDEAQAIILPIQYELASENINDILRKFLHEVGRRAENLTSRGADTFFTHFMEIQTFNKNCPDYDKIMAKYPNVWHEGRKLSRIVLRYCKAWDVIDNTREFNKLFADFCEDIKTETVRDNLIISLNPVAFITMSNPKNARGGETLVSCHSLNSEETSYQSGCSGYATDDVSIIAFTVNNINNRESWYYRKTTRQIFLYKDGYLCRSRLYTSIGGVNGQSILSDVYTDYIKKVILECLNSGDTWEEVDNNIFRAPVEFSGYPDFEQENFNIKIYKLSQALEQSAIYVGNAGLCITCGEDQDVGAFCAYCSGLVECDVCGDYVGQEESYEVMGSNGKIVYLCQNCAETYSETCEYCGERHYISEMHNGYCENCGDKEEEY